MCIRDRVECNQGKPQVNYKEAITKTAQSRETYKKQSGGHGKFACIDVTTVSYTHLDVYKRQS